MSQMSGGRSFLLDDIKELDKVFADIVEELSNQYLLSYASSNDAHDGSWRKILVELPAAEAPGPPSAGLPGGRREEEAMTARTLVGLASVWVLASGAIGRATAADAPGAAGLPRVHRTHRDRRDRRQRPRRADRRPDAGGLRSHDRREAAARRVGAVHQAGPAGSGRRRWPAASFPFTTNESAVGGRLVLIVFDLEGIGVGGGRGASVAASRFLDQLAAADRVGVMAFPNGASVDFTTDREKVKQTLMRVVGRGSFFADGIYSIGLSEAFEIDRGDPSAFERAGAA